MVYSWGSLGKFSGSTLSTGKIFDNPGKIAVIYGLTPIGEQRLKWLDYYCSHQRKGRLTCRYFGITPKTFYKAKKRYERHGYSGLNDLSRKPHRFRQSKIPLDVIGQIIELREKYPTWSKYKLGAYLRSKGVKISDSSIGRLLKRKGKINDKLSKKKKRIYKRSLRRLRIDGEIFLLKNPGDLIQLDLKHYQHIWGRTVYQFTAIDCVTKLRVLRMYTSKTARNGKEFLKEVIRFYPFRIKRVQSDNGSEFLGEFRKACVEANVQHFFSYPNSPEQNAFVESSHSTDEREFYSIKEMPMEPERFRKLLAEWEHCYNHERPHQSLNYQTPWQYYQSLCSKN